MIELKNFKMTVGNGLNPTSVTPTTKQNGEKGDLDIKLNVHILKPSFTSDELSVSEFASEANVTPQAVRKMITEGRVQARRLGNQYVISAEELHKYFSRK